MLKNTASQKLTIFAFDYSTSAPKTGDAANLTAYVSIDDGALTALTDTSATEVDATNGKGLYTFDLTQAETNGTKLVFSAKSSTANVSIVPQIIYAQPANFPSLSIDSNGRVDVIKIAGTPQTARDIGASVLLSAGTGTGQLDFTSGVVKSNMVQILATALTETVGGYLTAAFKKLFDVAVPVFTSASVNQTGDSFARLGAPAGASHAADLALIQADTDNLQTRIPAALTVDGNIKADTLRVGGTLQTAGDLASLLTIIYGLIDTEIAQILNDTTTDIPTQIAALNNLSAAQVKTQVTDALNVDTYAQPGQGAPAATTTMRLMLAYLYKWARNKRDNDGTTTNFYNDDAATVDHKQSTSEAAGTVTVGEMATGP